MPLIIYKYSAVIHKWEELSSANPIFYDNTQDNNGLNEFSRNYSSQNNLPDGSSGINNDGWFPTGDLATMDENGYINIVGRAKEMIIRGGENLYPIEIENYLLEHPGVLEVAVFGLPDDKYDEECCAVIRKDDSAISDENELRDWCKDRISRWKIPRYIFFIDAFPVTPSGKIQKYKLHAEKVKNYQNL